MVTLVVAELRPKLDMNGLFVDFNVIRTALSVKTITGNLGVSLSLPTEEGECRGKCPKCAKDRSFALNVNTNRFNCFAKGCNLKGGGAIDFFAKLNEVTAKEASHLLACAYGIQPYIQSAEDSENHSVKETVNENIPAESREVPDSSLRPAEDTRQTAAYLIASIKRQLTELEQLLISK